MAKDEAVTSKDAVEATELETVAATETTAAEKPKENTETTEEEHTAKAGKRSAKAIKEAEEKAAKDERKAAGDTSPQGDAVEAKRGPVPKARPLIERRGKGYRSAAKKIEADKLYSLSEALKLATQTNPTKFDATVEMHVNLGVDPRQADQNIRSTVALPNGTGKTVRVAVFAPADQHDKATKAGADIVGEDDFLQKLDKEQLDFDVLISTPQSMAKLGKYARLLGPRGLMPNPKSGTVTANVAKAVTEAKAGRIEYRVDKQGIVHQGIGKASFEPAKLEQNAKAFIESLKNVKPASVKGTYLKTITISTTMGPGIKVDVSALQ